MLKPEMIEKLNEQMNLELYSSLLYQQMSAWCSYHTFEGAAAFLRRHAQEEMTHMQRLFDYLTDTGNLPRINTVESPFAEYSSLDELFRLWISGQFQQGADHMLHLAFFGTTNTYHRLLYLTCRV